MAHFPFQWVMLLKRIIYSVHRQRCLFLSCPKLYSPKDTIIIAEINPFFYESKIKFHEKSMAKLVSPIFLCVSTSNNPCHIGEHYINRRTAKWGVKIIFVISYAFEVGLLKRLLLLTLCFWAAASSLVLYVTLKYSTSFQTIVFRPFHVGAFMENNNIVSLSTPGQVNVFLNLCHKTSTAMWTDCGRACVYSEPEE